MCSPGEVRCSSLASPVSLVAFTSFSGLLPSAASLSPSPGVCLLSSLSGLLSTHLAWSALHSVALRAVSSGPTSSPVQTCRSGHLLSGRVPGDVPQASHIQHVPDSSLPPCAVLAVSPSQCFLSVLLNGTTSDPAQTRALLGPSLPARSPGCRLVSADSQMMPLTLRLSCRPAVLLSVLALSVVISPLALTAEVRAPWQGFEVIRQPVCSVVFPMNLSDSRLPL